MRFPTVVALLVLAACSMANVVTKTYTLRQRAGDDLSLAIEKGSLALPAGVTMELLGPKLRAEVVSLTGEEAAVDQAVGIVQVWDGQIVQIVVKCEVRQGNRVVSAPILRTLSGEPASIAQSTGDAAGSAWGVRVVATHKNRTDATVRVSLMSGDRRLLVPFVLENEGTVQVLANAKGALEVRVVDTKTKEVRTAPVSADCKVFVGRVFAFTATVVADEG